MSGFTLIEALIVMIILASSMTAALYLLTTVVFSTQSSVKRTKAVYLAQECSELARNVRDSAWLNYQAWDCAFGSVGDEFTISYDYSPGASIASCNNLNSAVSVAPFGAGSDDNILWQNGATLTHQNSGEDSGYRRTIKHVDRDTNPETLDLECTVSWQFNGRTENASTTQTLTNWRKN